MIRPRLLLYIAAGTLLFACGPAPEPVIPVALAPLTRDSALARASATEPASTTAIRFRWRYADERVRYAGRGTARIAPPDSLRFDYAGPFGLGSGAAVIIGDSVVWADPERDFAMLVPAIPMLWAALGVVRPPPGEAALGQERRAPEAAMWWVRFIDGVDTLDYALREAPGRQLDAEWRRAGQVVARSRTIYTGMVPATARVDFPEGPARFELSVVDVDSAAAIPPRLWLGRR